MVNEVVMTGYNLTFEYYVFDWPEYLHNYAKAKNCQYNDAKFKLTLHRDYSAEYDYMEHDEKMCCITFPSEESAIMFILEWS
jgi:hypothetical protein